MLANVLLIVLVVGILLVLGMNVFLMRVIVRAVRNREAYEAANAVASADASDLSSLLVQLGTEHTKLTGYIHQAVHNIRDSLGAVSLRLQANHADLMNDLKAALKLVSEIHTVEMAYQAEQPKAGG